MTPVILWIVMTVCNLGGTPVPNYDVFESPEAAVEFASRPMPEVDGKLDCTKTVLRAEAREETSQEEPKQ